jgi:DNA-binding transcriptional ArsR family regulator
MVQKYEGVLYYELVQKISFEHRLSPSTVRWNLNKLRDAKLIVTGDKDRKGIPVKLTEEARLIVSVFNQLEIDKESLTQM